jgi:hypothetical protein
MTEKEVEELRYDVAHYLLSRMNAGSQFQYALDRMMQLCLHYNEQELLDLLPKTKDKSKAGKGF